jgi:UDPglucose 6-dehydrogenase
MPVAKPLLLDVTLCEDAYNVCEDADALVIITEWNLFRMLDLERVKALLRSPSIVDLRNVYKPEPVASGGLPLRRRRLRMTLRRARCTR